VAKIGGNSASKVGGRRLRDTQLPLWPSHDFGSSHVGVLTIETQMAQIRNSSGLATKGQLSAGSLVFESVEKSTCAFKKIIYVAEGENTYYGSADSKAGRY
jgi:hypothetical protein